MVIFAPILYVAYLLLTRKFLAFDKLVCNGRILVFAGARETKHIYIIYIYFYRDNSVYSK